VFSYKIFAFIANDFSFLSIIIFLLLLSKNKKMNFTVIDFETANRYRNSACALGVVRVENGTIKDKIYRLIRPSNLFFEYRNIQIHGITAYDVEYEPMFDEIYTELQHLFQDELLLAHNAPFDMSVLRATLESVDIALPHAEYIDSVRIARKLYPDFPNHKLNTLADKFGFRFVHHHALEDAEVTARIVLKMMQENGFTSIKELSEQNNVPIKKLS